MFSKRLPGDLTDSPFFEALSSAKKACTYVDLTVSSPLAAGLAPDLDKAIFATQSRWNLWNPSSSGADFAREAVVRYYAERGGIFTAGQILLTAGTSEAYSIIFKIFCDPGDTVLTPVPGYPLLDTLAGLEYLQCYPYFLKQCGDQWTIDPDSLLSAPETSKILLLVSPHNPTGHSVSEAEWKTILDFCAARQLVLIVDEVFGDYLYDNKGTRSFRWESSDVPVFWLNGLSKTVGSPQLKLGWIAYRGGSHQEKVKRALEYVADAYLNVSSTAQSLAVPLLANSLEYQKKIQTRLQHNLTTLRKVFPDTQIFPRVQGGWYAALHIQDADDEKLTLRLLKEAQVLIQPGFFFDFNEDGWIVISLLAEKTLFSKGVMAIQNFFAGTGIQDPVISASGKFRR
jgi:aspartate/methionine/tyrosine aminotransferase